MEDLIVSAPGKVILHGEHAVVYGKQALATSLNLRTYLRVKKCQNGYVHVKLPDIGLEKTWKVEDINNIFAKTFDDSDCSTQTAPGEGILTQIKSFAGVEEGLGDNDSLAIVAFLYLYLSLTKKNGEYSPIEIEARSQLPAGAGLGSSASYSVCLAAGLLLTCGAIHRHSWTGHELDLINSWAFIGETVIHGHPSGIDNSTCTYGGALTFASGKITRLERMPKLEILLTNTGVPRSTKVLVENVRNLRNEYPDVVVPVLNSIEAIVNKCLQILKDMDRVNEEKSYTRLEELFDMNHHLLCVLGVSHPSLENIRRIVSGHGLHTKLTGAGGGGCAITIKRSGCDDKKIESVIQSLKGAGYTCWTTSIGGSGVELHQPDVWEHLS